MADIAWAAGFIDGEGCIDLRQNRRSYTPRLRASQNNIAPLHKLVDLFGGTVYTDKHDKSEWYIIGPLVFEILKQLRPHLLVKGAEADVLLYTKHLWLADYEKDDWLLREQRAVDHALRAEKWVYRTKSQETQSPSQ